MDDNIEAYADAQAARASKIPAEVLADLAERLGIAYEG